MGTGNASLDVTLSWQAPFSTGSAAGYNPALFSLGQDDLASCRSYALHWRCCAAKSSKSSRPVSAIYKQPASRQINIR